MAEPFLATADITYFGVLAFARGDVVPDEWIKDHPDEVEGRTARRSTKAAEAATEGKV